MTGQDILDKYNSQDGLKGFKTLDQVIDEALENTKRKHNYPPTRKPTGPRPQAGRPADMVNPARVVVWIDGEDVDWLKIQPVGMAETIRRLVKAARGNRKCIKNKNTQT